MNTQEKTEKEVFRDEIDAFCAEVGMAKTTFGVACLNNGNFRTDLDKPSFDPKLSTITKVRRWMKNQRLKRSREKATIDAML